jgi:hypothetical protein
VATLRGPAYPAEPAIRIEAQPDPQTGTPIVHWARTDQPGVYAFELLDSAGSEVLRHVTVGVDTSESDLRRADRTALLASMPGADVEYVSGDKLITDNHEHARQELWSMLLVILVGILMVEQTLARWFGAPR